MKPYNELTRLGRLRRLRKLAGVALEEYGLTGANLTFTHSGGNVIFRVDAPGPVPDHIKHDPYVPNRYNLRMLATNHDEGVLGELTWLSALRKEANLPVPEPVPTPSGELLCRITTPLVSAGKLVSLMRWVDGHHITKNLLFKAGQPRLIDFEDCGYGYWMWDFGVIFSQWPWTEDFPRLRDAFFDGYTRVRTLPEAQYKHLDLFMAAQCATMVLWSSAFIKNDPALGDEYELWRNKEGHKLLRYFERN
jgi:Ser/Thr protein kinase RdoA (MazF antagonist)